MNRPNGFSLVEVLISLGIIGIIATLVIPNLLANYKQKAWDSSANVFEKKLSEATKQMNAEGILAGYSTTQDFVNNLSKYIKITKICQSDELNKCFTKTIKYGGQGESNENIDIELITTSENFGQKWNTETVGLQFSNGINGILAYNKGCIQDPYNNQISGINCIAILYDTNGFKHPNNKGKDVRQININRLGKACNFIFEDKCYGAPFIPEILTYDECEKIREQLGIKRCCYHYSCKIGGQYVDYWASAINECQKQGGNLILQDELRAMAKTLYAGGDLNKNLASEWGFKIHEGDDSPFSIWAGNDYSGDSIHIAAAGTHFYQTHYTSFHQGARGISYRYGLCRF